MHQVDSLLSFLHLCLRIRSMLLYLLGGDWSRGRGLSKYRRTLTGLGIKVMTILICLNSLFQEAFFLIFHLN
jgi:hypothetical protein